MMLFTSCIVPPPAFTKTYEINYPTLFLLQWTYQCSQQMQPQFEMKGMPKPLALQFSIQNCSCVIDEFREHYRYEEVLEMNEYEKLSAAKKMTQECMIGVNTDKAI